MSLRVGFHTYKWLQRLTALWAIFYLCWIRTHENYSGHLSQKWGEKCLDGFYLVTGVEYTFIMFGVTNYFLMNHALKGIAKPSPGFFAMLKLIVELLIVLYHIALLIFMRMLPMAQSYCSTDEVQKWIDTYMWISTSTVIFLVSGAMFIVLWKKISSNGLYVKIYKEKYFRNYRVNNLNQRQVNNKISPASNIN
jgi:hypothetical protein